MSTEEGYYDLSPDKRTLRSLRSDVTPVTAVEELVDNVLDNWRRLDSARSDITIDIDFDFEKQVFRIEDDSGGLNEENVKKIFALGGSTKEEIPNSIGAYGMGAKKAILRLGSKAEIKSRAQDADTGFGFVIDEEWLYSDDWQVNKRRFEEVDPGSTVIRIEGLDIELSEESESENDGDENNSTFETPQEYLETLREDLSETYDEFLKGRAGPEEGTVSIKVNGVRVEEQPEIDWAFTPFDGYHPRFYKQYAIEPDDIPGRDHPIQVEIVAGLMRTGKAEDAGTDVIIQNRRILTSNKSEMGGWGTHLPSFRVNLRRTRFRVKITAEKHPETLPWDTQKDKIEPNSVITDRVFRVLERAASDYAKVNYENFPTAYTSPYNRGSQEDENELETWQTVQPFSFNDRENFIPKIKPNSELTEKEQVDELVEYHQDELGIFAPHVLSEHYARGYRASFDPDNDPSGSYTPVDDDLWILPEEAERFPEQELHMVLEAVKDTAERHSTTGTTFDFGGENPWWREYYERILEENDSPFGSLEPSEELDGLRRRIEARGEQQDLTDPLLRDDHLRARDISRVFSEGMEVAGEDSETQSELNEHADQFSESGPEEEGEEGGSSEDSGGDGDNQEPLDAGSVGAEGSDDERRKDGGEGTEKSVDFGTTTSRQEGQTRLSNMRSIILRVRENIYIDLCRELELDPEGAKAREVGEAAIEQGVNIDDFIGRNNSEG